MKIDTIIIGAGISGLYSCHKLLNKNSCTHQNMAIFEKTVRPGGRLTTCYTTKNIPVELGAARFNDQDHPLLKALLTEFNIETSDFSYHNLSSHLDNKAFFNEILTAKLTQNIYFVDWVEKKFGLDYLRYLIETTGYDVLSNMVLPLSEAIKILSAHPETGNSQPNRKWMQISKGFSHLIQNLQASLEKKNLPIYFSHELIQLFKDEQGYQLSFYNHGLIKKYRANTVILAIPKDTLMYVHTNFNIQSLLNGISTVPLFKIFAVYPEKIWTLLNTSTNCYFTSTTPLRRIYCFPNKNQIVCYCDSKGATYWADLVAKQGVAGLVQELKQHISSVFKIDAHTIPHINELYYQYWPSGVSFWNKETEKLDHLNQYSQKNIFFVSDMFSEQPGWIEGALSNVENMIHNVPNHVNLID
jgi:monoamine oxidase